MKRVYLIVLLLGSLSGVAESVSGAPSVATMKLHDQTFGQGAYERVQKLTNSERNILLEYGRFQIEEMRKRDESVHQIAKSAAVRSLALLGDDWAREQVVLAFWYAPRAKANLLCYLKDAKVISMIGEGLFIEELHSGIGDVGFPPTQENIAEVVIKTLSHSPEFSVEVHHWARQVDDWMQRVGTGATMRTMREWYRANEAHLKAGNFKAVQPGAEPPERIPAIPIQTQSTPVQPPVSTPAAVSGNTRMQESSGNEYAWIAVLLLAICGGLVWFLRRTRT